MSVLYVKMENYNKSIKKKRKKNLPHCMNNSFKIPFGGLVVVVGCERIKVKLNTVVPL